MSEKVTEITEEEFQLQMQEAIEDLITSLARNKLYFNMYLALKNAGHVLLFQQNEDGTIFYYLLTQPLANHEDETMMIA